MDHPSTVKVKATDPAQGDHVVINKVDFDPEVHELFDEPTAAADKTAPDSTAAGDEGSKKSRKS